MIKFTVLTLFPEIFNEFKQHSIIKKAINNKLIEIEVVNFRDYSNDKHHKVDDTVYGGGAGMVLKLQPIVDCLKEHKTKESVVILLTPSGNKFTNKTAKILSKIKHVILICGHYEGFDERIINYIDVQVSIGDFVLTGGEIPAMCIIDSTSRFIEGVINTDSLSSESFEENLLDYPVYTKPETFDGYKVPEVLLSGNHNKINEYRKQQQILKTQKYRPDLYKKYLNSKKG